MIPRMCKNRILKTALGVSVAIDVKSKLYVSSQPILIAQQPREKTTYFLKFEVLRLFLLMPLCTLMLGQ